MRRRQDQKELEARWQRNRKAYKAGRVHHSLVQIKDGVAVHRPAEHPERLRANHLVHELARLSGAWQDARFLSAVEALLDHGIIKAKEGGRFYFTGKKEPAQQQVVENNKLLT